MFCISLSLFRSFLCCLVLSRVTSTCFAFSFYMSRYLSCCLALCNFVLSFLIDSRYLWLFACLSSFALIFLVLSRCLSCRAVLSLVIQFWRPVISYVVLLFLVLSRFVWSVIVFSCSFLVDSFCLVWSCTFLVCPLLSRFCLVLFCSVSRLFCFRLPLCRFVPCFSFCPALSSFAVFFVCFAVF